MKYFIRKNEYKASNVTLDAETLKAFSYGWWQFTLNTPNTLLFNDYSYSSSTCKHQSKVWDQLIELGVCHTIRVEVPCGFQDPDWVAKSIEHYKSMIKTIDFEMNRPRTHKAKNAERALEIEKYLNRIEIIKEIGKGGL